MHATKTKDHVLLDSRRACFDRTKGSLLGSMGGKLNKVSLNSIKNKERRQKVFHDLKVKKAKDKAERRKRKHKNPKSEEFSSIRPQKTIENTREYAEGELVPSEPEDIDDNAPLKFDDEFIDYFEGGILPKVAVTVSSDRRASKLVYELAEELCCVLPNSELIKKRGMSVKEFSIALQKEGFTDMIVLGEDKKQPNRMILSHLSNGGLTAMFKLSSLKLPRDIHNHGRHTEHKPELVLNNFTTHLGHRVGTMFAVLFPQSPEFDGRQVATFHNQRDFIFFRFHRYLLEDGKRAGLQELGPRFTLKLKWLRKGLFNGPESSDFEWSLEQHKAELSRKRFFL